MRRTHLEKRTYSARVMRFRLSVISARRNLTPGCQLLLLRLSDDMDAKCIVSIPRSALADDLDAAPPRITEWIKEARESGFLSVVRRGRPGVTATYQGHRQDVSLVRPGGPSQGYATPDQVEVRPGVPEFGAQRYAPGGTQEGEPSRASETNGSAGGSRGRDDGIEENAEDHVVRFPLTGCRWHEHHCPKDCADHPANREVS